MNLAASISVIAAVNAFAIAALASRIGSAPGLEHKRLFAFVALAASIYCACDVFSEAGVTAASTLLPVMRVQAMAAALHGTAWIVYAFAHLGIEAKRARTVAIVWGCLTGALALVPGVTFAEPIITIPIEWFGAEYRIPTPTTFGNVCYAIDTLVLAVPIALYVRHRKRRAGALLHAAGLGFLFLAAITDVLVTIGAYKAPFALSVGFIVSMATVGAAVTNAFVESARERQRLTENLEKLVEERTKDLVAAEAALLRSEHLAAVGKLSAGVAHEINNPSAAIRANLEYLRIGAANGALPNDAVETLDEALAASDRIAKIVRQLLDSTRAVATSVSGNASIARAVEHALADARPELGGRVRVDVAVPEGCAARGDDASLAQVFGNLLVNAAHAIPADRTDGEIVVRAETRESSVVVEVVDNGSGMPEDVQKRIFEPFFTTKPFGKGTGLGLSVSLGIVRSMGGNIEVESRPGRTTMRVVLAAPGTRTSVSRNRIEAAAPRTRLLLVDDDESVRNALFRSLRRTFAVTVATGVEDALAQLASEDVDVVLSDWHMPGGGGRRLYEELAARSPALASAMVFFTGGAPNPRDREWIASTGVPLLAKPLDAAALQKTIARRRVASEPSEPR